MSPIPAPHAILISVGEELLQGRIVDRNASRFARELRVLGYRVLTFRTVGDSPGSFRALLEELDGRVELLFSTGGLGPTEDDRIRAEAATVRGVPLAPVPGAEDRLRRLFRHNRAGEAPPPWFLAQGSVPEGALPILNPVGTALGFFLELPRGSRLLSLPGPPREAVECFERGNGRAILLRELPPGPPERVRSFHTSGEPESTVEARIRDLLAAEGPVRYGITAGAGQVTVSAAAGGPEAEALLDRAETELRSRLGARIWGRDREELGAVVLGELQRKGATLAVAESCTGGLLASTLTAFPGASRSFLAGWVCYSNAAKVRDLGVSASLLESRGAVSAEVAVALAEGARARAGSDWALSTTGIAGPGGGTEEKPLGLVWIGLAGPGGSRALRRRQWSRAGRRAVQRAAVQDALELLRRSLQGLEDLPERD